MSQQRVSKNKSTTEPTKRRTPYALRACEACRRRKGKCDGRQPCRHCASRNQSCTYTNTLEQTNDWQPPAPESISSEPCQPNQAAIVDMLSSLQAQLNSLAAQVQTQSSNPQEVTSLPSPVTLIESARAIVDRIDEENSVSTPRSSRTAASQNFYGPTCPDYALNVGQLKLRRDSLPLHQRQLQLASIHEDDASEESDPETQFAISPRTVDKG